MKHSPETCSFKDKNFFCYLKGHAVALCLKKKKYRDSAHRQHIVEEERHEVDVGDSVCHAVEEGMYTLYNQSMGDRTKLVGPVQVTVVVDGVPVLMEIDTGASLSVMGGEEEFRRIFGEVKLSEAKMLLKTFTGEKVKPVGSKIVDVKYNEQYAKLSLTVTPGRGPSLLGRNWLNCCKLNWGSLFPVRVIQNDSKTLESLLERHYEVFKDELGTLKDVTVHLDLKEGALPKIFKPRPVPYALKAKVEEELDRLVKLKIYEPVAHSAWAAPVVPVLKPNGKVRICGDYKVTINPNANSYQYPIPRTEDLFATLNGGEKFTKLDLSQAYQQLMLDEESREYLTVNTYKGLCHPTRLQFGVHAASGRFQHEMEKVLAGIPFVVARSDDILISGSSDGEHLENLSSVLKVLEEKGLKLKKDKCTFMSP